MLFNWFQHDGGSWHCLASGGSESLAKRQNRTTLAVYELRRVLSATSPIDSLQVPRRHDACTLVNMNSSGLGPSAGRCPVAPLGSGPLSAQSFNGASGNLVPTLIDLCGWPSSTAGNPPACRTRAGLKAKALKSLFAFERMGSAWLRCRSSSGRVDGLSKGAAGVRETRSRSPLQPWAENPTECA
jgi:hypothetical protein